MPKPNRGETETIKERAIYVYLPSLKFPLERVKDSIRKEEGEEGYLSRTS
ncbi:MAG: hypothetical protein V6S10_07925 [Candidatus Methanoglobus sp.]|jgi:hypothetical protein